MRDIDHAAQSGAQKTPEQRGAHQQRFLGSEVFRDIDEVDQIAGLREDSLEEALVSGVESSKKSVQPKAAPENSATSQNPMEFAIESEMLTYTAMDSEGAAVACGIARNVGAAEIGRASCREKV